MTLTELLECVTSLAWSASTDTEAYKRVALKLELPEDSPPHVVDFILKCEVQSLESGDS